MKTILKIATGVCVAALVLIGGCALLVGQSANEVQKESDKTAITKEQYRSIKIGMTKKAVLTELGKPESQDEVEIDGLKKHQCVSYGSKGEIIDSYQFCFEDNILVSRVGS